MVAFRPGQPNVMVPSPALLFCVLFSSYVSLCSVYTDSFRDFVGGCCLFQAFQEKKKTASYCLGASSVLGVADHHHRDSNKYSHQAVVGNPIKGTD